MPPRPELDAARWVPATMPRCTCTKGPDHGRLPRGREADFLHDEDCAWERALVCCCPNAAAGALLLAKESGSSTAELDALMSPEVIAAEMSGRLTETQQLAAEGWRSFRAEDDDETQFRRLVHFQ